MKKKKSHKPENRTKKVIYNFGKPPSIKINDSITHCWINQCCWM